MANPTFRASTNAAAQVGATFSVNKPAGTIDGDLLVAFQATATGAGTAPAAPTGWSIQGSHVTYSTNFDLVCWWKLASSEPASWTFNNATGGAGPDTSVYVIAVQGPPATSPEGTKTATSAGSSTADPGIYGTLNANDLLLVAWAIPTNLGAPAITPDASFTALGRIGDSTVSLNVGYKSQVAIGNTSATSATLDSSQAWAAILTALAAPGGSSNLAGYASGSADAVPPLARVTAAFVKSLRNNRRRPGR